MPGSAATADEILRVIAEPTRRALLDHLRLQGEESAGAIARRFDTTMSAISQHLSVLLEAGLVRRRREGRHQMYSLNAAPLQTVADWVNSYAQFWEGRLDALGEYLAREEKRERGKSR